MMPNHFYDPIGKCIYCGKTSLPAGITRFGDEHIIPLSLGGNLVLREASCKECEKIINREIETPVSSHEWGKLRSKRNFPSRKKQKRKTFITLRRVDGTPMNVSIKDYSAPVLLYRFAQARILSGCAVRNDQTHWTVSVLTDHDAEMEMKRKFPEWDQKHALKTQPYEFARLLAKIAYGYTVAEMGAGTFHPLVTDIILGNSDDYFYVVGGKWEIAPAVPGGDHVTNIGIRFVSPKRAVIIVDIRLFSSIETPDYHVAVGEIDLTNPVHAVALDKHRGNGKLKEVHGELGN